MRWYLMFPVSYRDLELMLLGPAESEVDHTTIFRWIQAYAVEAVESMNPPAFANEQRLPGGWTKPTFG